MASSLDHTQTFPYARSVLAGVVLLASAPVAWTAPILVGSTLYNGAEFSLGLEERSEAGYRFHYTADFSGWQAEEKSRQQYLAGISFKPNTGRVPERYELFEAPATDGSWQIRLTTLNNAGDTGCGDPGGAESFICIDNDHLFELSTTGGGSYRWLVDVEYQSALSMDHWMDMPIRAVFANYDGNGPTGLSGLMSENVSLQSPNGEVPAPGSLALLLTGLAGLGMLKLPRG